MQSQDLGDDFRDHMDEAYRSEVTNILTSRACFTGESKFTFVLKLKLTSWLGPMMPKGSDKGFTSQHGSLACISVTN
jgi:hypothetical protein